jgi:hypothetical protein
VKHKRRCSKLKDQETTHVSIHVKADFSKKTSQARITWHEIVMVLKFKTKQNTKTKTCQMRILYPAKLSFRNKGE